MKSNSRSLLALTLLTAFALAGEKSLAQTATVSYNGTNTGTTLNLTLPASGTTNYYAGSLNIDVGGTTFQAFCVDPTEFTTAISTTYNASSSLVPPFSGAQSGWVSNLYSQSYATSGSSGANAAAFQIALWELANDDGVLTTGNVIATNPGGAIELAAAILINSAQNQAPGSTQYSFSLYTNAGKQDYLVASVTPVPEPETYAMLLTGLGFLGVVARRRKGFAVTV